MVTEIPMYAEWRLDSPAFFSYEEEDGFLGVDYTDGVDHRFKGITTLGPLLNSIDLSAVGGTPADANGQSEITGPSSVEYAHIIRGTDPAKVQLSNMTVFDPAVSLAEAATGILYTKSTAGTEEVSLFMDNTAYRVITAVGAGAAADTHSANASANISRIGGYGSPANRVALLGRSGGAGTARNTVRNNILTGAVTMVTPTLSTIATIAGEEMIPTSFALDGDFWIIGTSNGPYFLDKDFGEFRPLIDEIDQNAEHCVAMSKYFPLGVIIPLKDGVRFSKNLNGASVGAEKWRGNRSPVHPWVTAAAASNKWLMMMHRNEITSETYQVAWRAAEEEDGALGGHPLVPFVIGKVAANAHSRYLRYTGQRGGRTLPTFMAGRGSNALYFGEGRTAVYADDTAFEYAASGTMHLTELTRLPAWEKEIVGWEMEVEGMASTETLSVSFTVDGRETIPAGVASRNGLERWRCPADRQIRGRYIKPQITFARGGTVTNSPKIRKGRFRVFFYRRPVRADDYYWPWELPS